MAGMGHSDRNYRFMVLHTVGGEICGQSTYYTDNEVVAAVAWKDDGMREIAIGRLPKMKAGQTLRATDRAIVVCVTDPAPKKGSKDELRQVLDTLRGCVEEFHEHNLMSGYLRPMNEARRLAGLDALADPDDDVPAETPLPPHLRALRLPGRGRR